MQGYPQRMDYSPNTNTSVPRTILINPKEIPIGGQEQGNRKIQGHTNPSPEINRMRQVDYSGY